MRPVRGERKDRGKGCRRTEDDEGTLGLALENCVEAVAVAKTARCRCCPGDVQRRGRWPRPGGQSRRVRITRLAWSSSTDYAAFLVCPHRALGSANQCGNASCLGVLLGRAS